jgi:3'-phosphoadenosine 5'-phosphosulfate sulfotransferase (PAPS reductase)/FAD synthetase
MEHIISFSGGKDSTAMVHLLLEQGVKISNVVYFETEWDFPQMDAHLDLVTKNTGLDIVKVRYYRHFNEQLKRYGWPKSAGGWCTARKHRTCLKYIRGLRYTDKTEYIGFSADEVQRSQTKWMKERKWPVKFPLIEAGFSESDSLNYCKDIGYHWDGLYDVFDRVSCFCCPKGGKGKRKNGKGARDKGQGTRGKIQGKRDKIQGTKYKGKGTMDKG